MLASNGEAGVKSGSIQLGSWTHGRDGSPPEDAGSGIFGTYPLERCLSMISVQAGVFPATLEQAMASETGPDHPFQHISRNVNKIVEQMQKGYFNFRPNDTWAPNVNLYETEADYLVCVDLAGVDKDKIDLEVLNGRLSIRGNRSVPSYDEPDASAPDAKVPDASATGAGAPDASTPDKGKLRVHMMEIDHGAFFREVELPEHVAQSKISAHYRNGMLWIELPKK
jgi:HSP20 family molecular chaperone IbpA